MVLFEGRKEKISYQPTDESLQGDETDEDLTEPA
jgi:hypothetical protein